MLKALVKVGCRGATMGPYYELWIRDDQKGAEYSMENRAQENWPVKEFRYFSLGGAHAARAMLQEFFYKTLD